MIKKVVWFVGLILCLLSCGKDYAYRVEGKLSNLEDQTIFVIFEREDYNLIDTVICEKPGQFVVKQTEEGFNSVTILYDNKTQWFTAYLKPGDNIIISGDANYPLLFQVKGGKINEKLSAVRKELAPLLKDLTEQTAFLHRKGINTVEETEIASRISNINLQLSEDVMKYIKDNPDEEASVVLIKMFFAEPDDTRKMDELLAMLDPELKNFYLVNELEQYSIRAKRITLGAEAPDFSLKNVYGNTVNLSSFPDKYLLLAFTAPWCDMCQTEDLLLDKVAMQYPKDKVDILLISLDDNQRQVRDMLAKDSIQWNLVTDSAGQATMMLELYNVSALPRCFLIDEEGKIILKTDNGIEIKQSLDKIFEEEE
ncbi:TlpA disulfide reductase family protein [Parabacteroides sp. PF5-9]|uniref:TlpA disulfide reductase family protein n=1 Tax=Parabacteroides sp. PF5-9 TaxID=1742404 RepID=UPI0024747AEB|nr:TlpA disulfide reductase family protein [Parabacteroides sp. PF5-9]MDH6356423.1 peroxiredoxin [Parabacteroides sp. PF5-9]